MESAPHQRKERAAYSLKEFAEKFGRERSWSYRLVKDKKVKTICGFGAMMIPASEVARVANGGGAQ
jgi:hypothetical protein